MRWQAVQQQLRGGHLAGPQFILQPLDLDPLQPALGVPADLSVEQGQTPAALGGRSQMVGRSQTGRGRSQTTVRDGWDRLTEVFDRDTRGDTQIFQLGIKGC